MNVESPPLEPAPSLPAELFGGNENPYVNEASADDEEDAPDTYAKVDLAKKRRESSSGVYRVAAVTNETLGSRLDQLVEDDLVDQFENFFTAGFNVNNNGGARAVDDQFTVSNC
jgi:hypothetical protein